jgi:phosphatidylserine decarboxylase
MDWSVFGASILLSIVLIVPLGTKWNIDRNVTIPVAPAIGTVTYLLVSATGIAHSVPFLELMAIEVAIILLISFSLLLWRFYRDPERIAPKEQNIIVSPADGKVIYVKRVKDGQVPFCEKHGRQFFLGEFYGTEGVVDIGYLIGISMNFLDVHVNRAPMGGRISALRFIKGSFLSLREESAFLKNARLFTEIDNGTFKIGVIQITSRLVRKIVAYRREGENINIGDRIGMIRFGSQVDLMVPDLPVLEMIVKAGSKVTAGSSIIATYE